MPNATITVDAALKARLADIAGKTGQSVDEFVEALLRRIASTDVDFDRGVRVFPRRRSHRWSKTAMLRDVVSVQALPEHRLRVTFDDGIEGVVDVAQLVDFTGVFEPLRDPEFFARATVHPELGTVCWPNNADLDSDVLYAKVAGVPVPEYATERRRA